MSFIEGAEFEANQGTETWRNKAIEELDCLELQDMLRANNVSVNCLDVLRDLNITGRMFSMDGFTDMVFKSDENAALKQKFGVTQIHVVSFDAARKEILASGGGGKPKKKAASHQQYESEILYKPSRLTTEAPNEGEVVLISDSSSYFTAVGNGTKEACGTDVAALPLYSSPANRWIVKYREDGQYISFAAQFNPSLALDLTGFDENSSKTNSSPKLGPYDEQNDNQSFQLVFYKKKWGAAQVYLIPKKIEHQVLCAHHNKLALDKKKSENAVSLETFNSSHAFPAHSTAPARPAGSIEPEASCGRGCDCSGRCVESWFCCPFFVGYLWNNVTKGSAVMPGPNWGSELQASDCAHTCCCVSFINLIWPQAHIMYHTTIQRKVNVRLGYLSHNSLFFQPMCGEGCCGIHFWFPCAANSSMARDLEEANLWNGSICTKRTARAINDPSIAKEEEFPDPNYWAKHAAATGAPAPDASAVVVTSPSSSGGGGQQQQNVAGIKGALVGKMV